MLMSKHTKGEWKKVFVPKTQYNNYERYEIQYGEDGECVAEIVHKEADAKLIVMAPELLNALKALTKAWFDFDNSYDGDIAFAEDDFKKELKKAYAIIDKAEYTQPKQKADLNHYGYSKDGVYYCLCDDDECVVDVIADDKFAVTCPKCLEKLEEDL
jgi:hypothetical protein